MADRERGGDNLSSYPGIYPPSWLSLSDASGERRGPIQPLGDVRSGARTSPYNPSSTILSTNYSVTSMTDGDTHEVG
jgi:hypothetical protein